MTEDEDFQKHHLPQPCMFCSNMAGYSPLQDRINYGVYLYFCQTCQAEYMYFRDGTRASCSLYTKINDKVYRWTTTTRDSAVLFYVAEPGIPGIQSNNGLKRIREFDKGKFPQVTPANINDKIRAWLPFL